MPQRKRTYLEFFAGSGLVCEALKGTFEALWANDICRKKAAIYGANHGIAHFQIGTIEAVNGASLPTADMAWASFPCQDLSLAGALAGLNGTRSGLVKEWFRILRELGLRRPPVLVLENVKGLVSANGGSHYRNIHRDLISLGYQVGAVELDAILWVPQSRPRIFVVAVPQSLELTPHAASGPNWLHSSSIINAAVGLEHWVWWKMPKPPQRHNNLEDIIEWSAPCDSETKSRRIIDLIPPSHKSRLLSEHSHGIRVAPGYRRTRQTQVLELRFDGNAGCLRTPEGGSSRQYLVMSRERRLSTRLLTIREAARLMGAPESYKLPGSYNDAYRALGDAVAVPAAKFLAKKLLVSLVDQLRP